MNQLIDKRVLFILLMLGPTLLLAQSIVSGTITDKSSLVPLIGANILVKGTVSGTTTGSDGSYLLKVAVPPPFTLVFSHLGYHREELVITEATTTLNLAMQVESMLGKEIVVSASRMKESILESPVTIERMGIFTINQSAAPDYYDALANIKGVQVTSGSLNFTAVNTRGFADIRNVRFVQMVDGMDTSDPVLNFPTGSIHALGELDAESLELLPGAASALYGPNAFNGIMIMKSKSPFEYPGLSMMVKQGITNSNAGGAHALGTYSLRYAKSFQDKWAFKINFYYMQGTDWTANDYTTDRNKPNATIDLSKTDNFDGLNLYGDEIGIPINAFGIGTIRRTGIQEATLLDSRKATNIKGDVALHYRINEKAELIGVYRIGGGNTIFQGDAKYALRDFSNQFFKLELKGDNYFVRGYVNAGNAGKTYNMDALGALVNEYFNPTIRPDGSGWATDYVTASLGGIPGIVPGDSVAARSYADRFMIDPVTRQYTASFQDTINKVRTNYFQKLPPGATFDNGSRMSHYEFYYNFQNIQWADIIFGGNFRQYSLFSNATLFDEAPLDSNNPKRILSSAYGGYTQLSKDLFEKLRFSGSIRYDIMKDFDGHITPRVSLVYSPNENHNVRMNFQTGFRFPDMQLQFLYFDNPTGIFLGGVPSIASRYGVYNGGSWTQSSYDDFVNQGGSLNPTTGEEVSNPGNVTLVTANFPYIKPEQLSSFEVGYKGLITGGLYMDFNYYYNTYTDFLSFQKTVGKQATQHQGKQVDAGRSWLLSVNSPYTLRSNGIGIGLTYTLLENLMLTGNYNYTTFWGEQDADFLAQFNTPRNHFSIGLGSSNFKRKFGFNVNYRYQDAFLWQSPYGTATIPSYGVLDAQLNYKLPAIKTILKVGGTNLGGNDYRTNFGAPYVGQIYYVSLLFDEFLN